MPKRIPIGMCGNLEEFAMLAPGYDYLEPSVARTLSPLEDDAAMAERMAALRALQPPIRAFNIFVPEAVPLTGPAVDWDRVALYVSRGLGRAATLGARVIVFGSAAARRVPDGFPYREAWGQLVRFLSICADHASAQNLTIAIEPVYSSNIITSYLQAVALAKEVGREEIKVVADIIHFWKVNEPLEDIYRAPEYVAHVHVSDTERRAPGPADPHGAVQRLFEILHDIGYQGLASVEAQFGDDYTAESAAALAYLRDLAG